MLKSLYPTVNWDKVRSVGFDLDGTLYDEFNFIEQVYRPIGRYLAGICMGDEKEIYVYMLQRWLEKGSSYNQIFNDVLSLYEEAGCATSEVIQHCLKIYRNYRPILELPRRVNILLNYFAERYPMFLITDGQSSLQRAKISALGLGKWFSPEHIFISGDYGSNYQKPALLVLEKIKLFSKQIAPESVVYFGDRQKDLLFAVNAGFQFMSVYCMQPTDIL